MIKKIVAVTGFAALMLSASVSNAIYVEPYLGLYSTGKSTMTSPTPSESDISGNLGLGLRLGYNLMGLSFGIDYDQATTDSKATSGTVTKVATTNLGAFVSFSVPVLPVRAYATYVFDSKSKPDGGAEAKGNGGKIGVSFTGLPLVFINLDIYALKYTESNGASIDQKAAVTALSVSLPLSF